jgi:hypothetical protein
MVAVTQRPPPTKECSLTDTLIAQIPILFLCGLAYIGVKSKCTFAPTKPASKAQEMLPTTGIAAPSQTPVIQASQVLGTTNPVEPFQTPALTQELDEDASTRDRAWAAVCFIDQISNRLIFIIPKLIKGDSNFVLLWLYVIDLALLGYFALQQRYCPGCLYNHLHVLIKGKKLKPLFVSTKSRFSGTRKLIVGVGAIATLVHVVESISEVYCFFKAETPWQPKNVAYTIWMAAGVLKNSLQSLVAVVAYVTFCCFGMEAYLRFYLSCLIACLLRQAKSKLRTQQSSLERGVDQRHIFEKVGGVFSSHYSKDSVNQRIVENAEREVESLSSAGGRNRCGVSIPDFGSKEGTRMYKFWALIWESLGDSLPGLIWKSIPTELQERIISIPQALYKRVCARAPAPEPQCEY